MIKVKVRGGYEFAYRHNLYRSGEILEMEEGDYKGLAHLFDVVKSPVKEPEIETPVKGPEKESEPEVVTEVVEPQENRAILKPARTRSRR